MIRKTVTVPLDPARAFDLFARRLGDWWPVESHSVAAGRGERPAAVTVEPREGGLIYETAQNGERTQWGRVARWAPGERLDLDWWPGRTEADASRVSVRFVPEQGGTRVDLTHAGLGPDRTQTYRTGWGAVLSAYRGAFAAA